MLGSERRIWNIEDFDGSPGAVGSELRRLVRSGELQRVRRGVYWRGRKSRFGMTRLDGASVLRSLVGSDEAIGVTGWSAANALGLSTQVAPTPSLVVTARVPSGLGIRAGSRAGRTGRRKARLNGLEVTLLEALEGWDRYVELGPEEAVRRFEQILGGGEVRIRKLVAASATEPPVVRERLRAVLAQAGHGADAERIPRARDSRTREKALRVLERS